MRMSLFLAILIFLSHSDLAFSGESVSALPVEEPDGYRQTNFRAPVPVSLQGATIVDAEAAYRLWKESDAVFIDVLPRPPQPKNIKDPSKWRVPTRFNIKGSIWLPNVGFGRLHPTIEAYFRSNLQRATGGNQNHSIVLYCLANCWMSWNAAKRALSYGYENVFWFPGGTNDWDAMGYPLEEKLPEPHLFRSNH